MWYIRLVRQGEWLWMSLSPYYPLATQVAVPGRQDKTRVIHKPTRHLGKNPWLKSNFWGLYTVYIKSIRFLLYLGRNHVPRIMESENEPGTNTIQMNRFSLADCIMEFRYSQKFLSYFAVFWHGKKKRAPHDIPWQNVIKSSREVI